jgi:hypothetical protein
VDVCAFKSSFWKITDSPGLIVIVLGMKQSGSQPGDAEPRAFSTVFDEDDVASGSGAVGGGGLVEVELVEDDVDEL